jgi:hypothetical protein
MEQMGKRQWGLHAEGSFVSKERFESIGNTREHNFNETLNYNRALVENIELGKPY